MPAPIDVTSAASLSQAIATIDADSLSDPGGTTYTIDLSGSAGAVFDESATPDAVNLANGDSLVINGNGDELDGQNGHRGLFVYAGVVTVNDLNIGDTAARGGAGGGALLGGGGGAGLGGGLFVAAAGNVTLNSVGFVGDSATGGAGGSGGGATAGGGGGGMGGPGGAGGAAGYGGGGGLNDSAGGAGDSAGTAGMIPDEPAAGSGYKGGGGGADGGGGGGSSGGGTGGAGGGGVGGVSGGAGTDGSSFGGKGGFGGGGGGGLSSGGGGFGGGGGGGLTGGGGGFGGGGGGGAFAGGAAGFGAGEGGHGSGSGGGGGLGAGGDIFVQAGGQLTISGSSILAAGTVKGGAGSDGGGSGSGLGSGIFLEGGQDLIFSPGVGYEELVGGVIADLPGSGGTGDAGSLTLDVGGTLDLTAQNTFSGGVTINAGTLDIGPNGSAGSGAITFGTGPSELEINTPAVTTFANTLTDLTGMDKIDLTAVAYVAGASASGSTLLTVKSGSTTETFNLVLTEQDVHTPVNSYVVSNDGSGGTLITPYDYTNVNTEYELQADIKAIDLASLSATGAATNYTISLGADIDESASLYAINMRSADSLTINGQGFTLNGEDANRGLFVYAGNVTIENLTIANAVAVGGAGGNGLFGGGGGGAGLGGGLFVATAGEATLSNVVFSGDKAAGGAGGGFLKAASGSAGGGGGGGLGGAGGASDGPQGSSGNGGGGGVGGSGGLGGVSGNGSAGLIVGAQGGGKATGGGGGGASGGGGGGGNRTGGAGGGVGGHSATSIGRGANGEFGGGGGGGNDGDGGFGGGGGGAASSGGGGASGGAGGFGGGGGGGSAGASGAGGFGAGKGASQEGGGGLGAGGDIFVQAGGSLSIDGGSLSGGSVAGGLAGAGGSAGSNGQAYGSGIFLQADSGEAAPIVTLAANVGVNPVATFSDVIADERGSGGGTGSTPVGVAIGGASQINSGIVQLEAANTYSGGTTINSGTLEIGVKGSAGSGAIVFASQNATLQIDAAAPSGATFANTIANFAPVDQIDLHGMTYVTGATAVISGSTLKVTSDGTSESFTLSGAIAKTVAVRADVDGDVLVMATPPTIFNNVSTASQLSQDIQAIDLASQAVGGAGVNYQINLTSGLTLTEAADIDAVNLKGKDALVINGGGDVLDGAGAYRGLFVYSGNVTIENLKIQDAAAIGGAGGGGGVSAGGGGAGLGGGLFVATAGDVTLNVVTFSSDNATGGAGASFTDNVGAGGGGGMGGDGGGGQVSGTLFGAAAGGGVSGAGGAGGNSVSGGPGIIPGAIATGHGTDGLGGTSSRGFGGAGGGASGASGGGGGAGASGGAGGGGGIGAGSAKPGVTLGRTGGNGGFGGGGGGGSYVGGLGGFGGGGGGGSHGGDGGFGGGGGASGYWAIAGGSGGFGAGAGASSITVPLGGKATSGGGGGGLGAGGDIFVQSGATLTIESGSLSGGSVTAGLAGSGGYVVGQNGQAFGSGIFLQGSQNIALAPAAGTTEVIADVIADQTGSGGTGANAGAGRLTLDGAGTLDLEAANTFTGGVTIEEGTLEIAAKGAAGAGEVTFAGASASLRIVAALGANATFANGLAGLAVGDQIDLNGLAFATGASATLAGSTLTIVSGAVSNKFTLSGAVPMTFSVVKDASGGSDVTVLTAGAGISAATAVADAASIESVKGYQVEIDDTFAHIQANKPALNALIASGHVSSLVVTDVTGEGYDSYEYDYDIYGDLTVKKFFYAATGQPYSSYEYDYSAGNAFIGSKFFYTDIAGHSYTGEEVDYDGADRVTGLDFTGVSGSAYSSYEYDYVGGVFAGSKFTFTSVPHGATYSSYETDYDHAGKFTGDKFFFTDVAGASYTGEAEDFDANGKLSRVLLTGVKGQAYSSLEEDYNAGIYSGYKVYYTGISGESYAGQEIDVSTANQIVKAVYTDMTSTPYQSVEQDYSGGAIADTIYGFTKVAGATYYAYQVEENSHGALIETTYDLNNGGHAIVGAQNGLTLTSLGDDTMTGGGTSETFVFNPTFGADKITDFAAHDGGVGHDTISLDQSEFASYAAVEAAATFSGGNAILTAADGDSLTLKGVTALTSAMSADFTFHG